MGPLMRAEESIWRLNSVLILCEGDKLLFRVRLPSLSFLVGIFDEQWESNRYFRRFPPGMRVRGRCARMPVDVHYKVLARLAGQRRVLDQMLPYAGMTSTALDGKK